MHNQNDREYKMTIDPKILRLLGPNLYTNIYYVLAELIANAYDADAKNVYIISEPNRIIVEDDGDGMSYNEGVKKYLNVAEETRTNKRDSLTKSRTRKRMGRKGVGKLAALSVSDRVLVKTKQDGDLSGFVLAREISKDGKLDPLPYEEITFEKIHEDHGTSIVMENPRYELNKTVPSIKRNLLKIFPLVNEKFRVHIIAGKKEILIDNFDKEMTSHLGGLIVLGEKFYGLAKSFTKDYAETSVPLLSKRKAKKEFITLRNKKGRKKTYELVVEGWIGVYRTSRNKKLNYDDFPDNFISLLSNNKLGDYNILPVVGRNRLNEVYVVGQLHIDLFEETELPDMSLSNRQGYITDDLRYTKVISFVRDKLLLDILNVRKAYSDAKKLKSKVVKLDKQKEKEELLKEKVDEYKKSISEEISRKFADSKRGAGSEFDEIKRIVESEANDLLPIMGLKSTLDSQRKKILISHTSGDKDLADVIFSMLVFNNVPPEDIIYTSSEHEASRPPNRVGVFDYLRKFFVESISKQGIYVIFVTSNEMSKSWGAPVEAGAGWITQVDHEIFNVHGYRPEEPLNTKPVWHTTVRNGDDLTVNAREYDRFAVKIEQICSSLGYNVKDRISNKKELLRYITVEN